MLLAAGAGAARAELTTTAAVRALAPEVAAKGPAVRLNAVVTFAADGDGGTESYYPETTVQDSTGSIFVNRAALAPAGLKRGDLVEVVGTAAPGGFAPLVSASALRVVGPGQLPDPLRPGYPALKSGQFDTGYVEVEGIVRDVQYDAHVIPPSTLITLAVEGQRLEVFMVQLPEALFAGLIDARVRVRAVVFSYFNGRRQTFDFRLMACEASQLEVLAPPPADAGTLPVTPAGKILQFEAGGPTPHRVRVRGVVSLHWPGQFLFLQDGRDGLRVLSRVVDPLRPGEVIEVTAFAAMGEYAAQLEDARFRRISQGAPPPPLPRGLDELASGVVDAQLVETRGELEGTAEQDGRATLLLRRANLLVTAELPVPLRDLPDLRPGSFLQVTGVCQAERGPQRRFARYFAPESARLLLRSPADITVLKAAPWWTSQRLGMAVAALAGVLGIAMLWASSLRRKNSGLEAAIAARLRAEEEVRRRVDERNLLAADLHDSLEQSLTGVALQLRAARDGLDPVIEKNQPHLTLAERLLDHSRAEVHRTVRDLRQPGHEPLDLPAALRDLARLSSTAAGTRVDCTVPDSIPALPDHMAYQLLRLAQEGVTNALKHARARTIRLQLQLTAQAAVLTVADDGAGYDPAHSPGPAEGHFGVQGMKERVARLDGILEIDTRPGDGTRLTAQLPLPS